MYPETKIYHDGSHFLGIPHKEVPYKQKQIRIEEEAIIYDDNEQNCDDKKKADTVDDNNENEVNVNETEDKQPNGDEKKSKPKPDGETKSKILNRLFDESKGMSKSQRKAFIIEQMRKYFPTSKATKMFVQEKLERKRINLIDRRMRFSRKANLNDFNYFVTFTRNDALHDEISFRKKLSRCLRNYHSNHEWLYMGVWERSKTGRLHFHVIMNIPDGTMPGELIEVEDYGFDSHKMQKTTQNTFFNKRFGRTDFKVIPNTPMGKNMAVRYITKYLEKTGEKIVYSRGIPMYYISDIEEDDVLTTIQTEYGDKLVLYDKFNCWDEGCYVGEMGPETKKQLRTANH